MGDIIKSPATCAGCVFTEKTVGSVTTVTLKSCRYWGELATHLSFGLAIKGVKPEFLTADVAPDSNPEVTRAAVARRSLDVCLDCTKYEPKEAA